MCAIHGQSRTGCLPGSRQLYVCLPLLQTNNPLHLWRVWEPEVRLQRRCLARNNILMGEKVRALRKNPPAPHTIAGEKGSAHLRSLFSFRIQIWTVLMAASVPHSNSQSS